MQAHFENHQLDSQESDQDAETDSDDSKQDEEMKLIIDDEKLNFLSNHSSQRLTVFLCKALAPALVTLLAIYSWLPVLYISVGDKETSIGIGLALTSVLFLFDIMARGFLHRLNQIF